MSETVLPCVSFISYIENQADLRNITELDFASYRELKNL